VYYQENIGNFKINYSNEDGYIMKPWKLQGLNRNYGNAKYDTSQQNTNTIMPLDSRRDCNLISGLSENHNFKDSRSGNLTFNLTVYKDITTPPYLVDTITNINVLKKVIFKLSTGKTFTMQAPTTPSGGYTHFYVQDSAYLFLQSNSKLILESPNKLTLRNKSNLVLAANSEIIIKPGATFCNQGAKISGPGKIIFTKGNHYLSCATVNDLIANDSTKIVLLDSAVVVLPDDFKIKLSGKESKLILNPYSKILFGEDSKIELDNSAKLIANNATFASSDTTKKWDGIYSSGTNKDTIANCKIINADNGINLIDKSSEYSSDYFTIIKDCEFINKSNSELVNAFYAYNSDRILFRGNHIYSETSSGFQVAIDLEYCITNDLNILDNTIDNSSKGIVDIQSSAYIARNSISNSTYEGFGITLDNSNGIVEYNSVQDFKYSLHSYMSSPYLLKNRFRDAEVYSLNLESYSLPLMTPIVSGELKYWYGGDNEIRAPENGIGIFMSDESYPLMNNGYNRFYMDDGDSYISGYLQEDLKDSLPAVNNYWYPSVSQSIFDITDALAVYSPTEDGSAGNRYYNNTFLMSIGFGLYDTVYITDESDNPVISDIYLSGCNYYSSGNYEDALDDFEEVVSLNDNKLSPISLQRVYNCYERANYFNAGKTAAKNYFSGISSDTSHTEASRKIAEDLYLKVKFRNGE